MKKLAAVSVFALCAILVGGTVSADMGKAAPALKAAVGSQAESHNNEGIEHYNQGHWDVALKHFTEAAKADPKSAEAHYNLALTLDKGGDHKGATESGRGEHTAAPHQQNRSEPPGQAVANEPSHGHHGRERRESICGNGRAATQVVAKVNGAPGRGGSLADECAHGKHAKEHQRVPRKP